jgi:hypothetical protein
LAEIFYEIIKNKQQNKKEVLIILLFAVKGGLATTILTLIRGKQ